MEDMKRVQYGFHDEQVASTYLLLAEVFHELSPSLFPAFACAWLELIANRHFLDVLLQQV